MQTICSYEWDDVDAGVLCRYLDMGMSGRATHLPRDWSFVRANAYGVYCHGNETDAYDCYVSENDTTNGMCATILCTKLREVTLIYVYRTSLTRII
jgi:hypothetical protein